jgi:hypothetical protein
VYNRLPYLKVSTSLLSAALALGLVLPADAAGKKKATPVELAQVVQIFKQTCLKEFSAPQRIPSYAAKAGLSPLDDGNWKSSSVMVVPPFRAITPKSTACSALFTGHSKTTDMSDALQAALPTLGLQDMNVLRKGVRLDVEFEKNGVAGWLRTESLGGFTSSIIVLPRARKR